ncbi:hypothetical protein [Streptomyces azureus]|uniref:hypothetical protein n=1 Tax=Streptomyces azureus TaxID=146537 RepID=UPI002E80C03C|nr:hypothetical protein [Streptomyces azureus]
MGSDTVTGTAERRGAPRAGGVQVTARQEAEGTDRDHPADEAEITARGAGVPAHEDGRDVREQQHYRPLWVEEPARRRRLPDPVRTAAVRSVILIALTLIQAMVAFLCTMAGSWLAFPMVISSVVSTIVATWGALDVWVTRQVWNQRNGVVSMPSSTARALRRERRRARRQARAAERAQERIRRRGGAGQLSHS